MMLDILKKIEEWKSMQKELAVATVVKTWGSAPRGVGAKMVVNQDGDFAGSVSGGCVEGAVIEEASSALRNQQAKILHFGVADDTAWEVGLACGGEIEVFVEPWTDEKMMIVSSIRSLIEGRKKFIVASVIKGPRDQLGRYLLISESSDVVGNLHPELRKQIAPQKNTLLKEGISFTKDHFLNHDPVELFFEYHTPQLRLVIVGGVHIASALTHQAKSLGYQVYIVDPRSSFGSKERFPDVDGLISEWPDKALMELGLDRYTAVAVLSHDPKLDDPALQVALPSDAFYVGALGSRETQRKRRLRLEDSGLSEEDLSRLKGPIGLNLGGRSPAEIALSILAEVVACLYKT
jgi:xanthine dehydrogenase accessory factor